MSYNNALTMYVVNNTGQAASFAFSHRYSSDPVHTYTTNGPIAPGAFAGPLMVGYMTGVSQPGLDYWYCRATLSNGQTFATEGTLDNPQKECMCQAQDDGMIYFFPFSTSAFVMPLISGPCSTGVSS